MNNNSRNANCVLLYCLKFSWDFIFVNFANGFRFKKFYPQIFLNCCKMAAVTVYVLDASEIIDPGYQACVLLYKFGHPIILSKDI